jgi:hypothetical protein
MAHATDDYSAWVAQADIPLSRLTPQLDTLLRAVFCFRRQQGSDYYSTRLISHFLLHCDWGLKVAPIARLLGIARPTASKQQGMSSKGAIQQAHHRMDGRSHGKLLPRYAGPIAAFLIGHPKATQADLIAFVARTFDERVSRIALYKFLKKYGLNSVAGAARPPTNPVVDTLIYSPRESPAATAPAPNISTAPILESPTDTTLAPSKAPIPAVLSAPLIAADLASVPAPVIELARAIDPGKPPAPPFSTPERNTPALSC